MNVSLTPELDHYVLSKVQTGRYNSASEVLREALRLMQERDEFRSLQLTEARLKIQNGLEALAIGDYVEDTSTELYEQAIARSRQRVEDKKRLSDAPQV
ncbi:MAG TPA: type II toxin-antitoxin system ParD family antitoxin [Fimbriimonadaceae bacterium]|jgi:antitoxin ParD1/3/4